MRLWPLFTLILVTGCASSLTEAGKQVRASDGSHLEACTFRGDHLAESGLSVRDAQIQLVNRVAAKGATHVVWGQLGKMDGLYVVRARAYGCPA